MIHTEDQPAARPGQEMGAAGPTVSRRGERGSAGAVSKVDPAGFATVLNVGSEERDLDGPRVPCHRDGTGAAPGMLWEPGLGASGARCTCNA